MQLLFIDQWFTDRLLKAMSWMLVHSLWQGLIAALLAAIIISATKKAVARIRYNLLGAVMILFLLATFVTFCIEWQHVVVVQPITENSSVIPSTDYYPAIIAEEPVIINEKTPGMLDEFTSWFNANTDIFILIWMAFFVFNCLKLVTGIAAVHRIRHYRTHSVTEEWTEKLKQLSAVVGIQKQVRFLQSELIKVPVTVGFLKPLILVPVGLINHLSPEQVETILLHELAHIRRKDYLINIFQRVVEAVFFFNPAMMWLSSLIRQEREACCDDIVLKHTHQKRNYLDALVAFEEYTLLPMRYAVGFSGKRHYLLARVKRMVTRENKSLGILEKLILAGCIMLFMAFSFISREQEHEIKKRETIIAELEQLKSLEKKSPVVSQFKPELQRKLVRTASKPNIKLARLPFDTIPKPKDSAISFVGQKIMVVNEKGIEVNGKKQMHLKILVSDGRKFTVEKQDDQIVGLIFDGKRVEEKDLPKYIQLFQRVNSGGDGSVRIDNNSKETFMRERRKTINNERDRVSARIAELNKVKKDVQSEKNKADQLLKSGNLTPEQQKEVRKEMENIKKAEQNVNDQMKEVKKDMYWVNTMEYQWKSEITKMEEEIERKVEEQIQKEKDRKEAQEDNKKEKNKNQDKPGKKDGKDQGEGKGEGQGKGHSSALPTDAQWATAANNKNGWKLRREPVFGRRPNKLFETQDSKENQTKDAKPANSGDEGKSKDKQTDKKTGNKPGEMKQTQNNNSNSNSNGNSDSNDEGRNKDRKPEEKNDKEKAKDRKEAKEESDREKKTEQQSEKKESKKGQKQESKPDVNIDVKLKESRSGISLESGSNQLWAVFNRKLESVKFDLKTEGFKLENNMRSLLFEDKIKVSSPVSIEQPSSPKPVPVKKPATISL